MSGPSSDVRRRSAPLQDPADEDPADQAARQRATGSSSVRRATALRIGRAVAVAAVGALTMTACVGPTGGARVEQADPSGDGTLRIGMILDNTGPQNFLNAPQLAAARLAVREINAAGGHKGKPVELLPETISADTAAQARALVAAQADVVVGPTDSSRAPAAIDVLSNAKIALISPANAASGLSRYQSQRILLPNLGSRHRAGPRAGQARQGQRCRHPRRGVRGGQLRQGRVERRRRRGQAVRPRICRRRRIRPRPGAAGGRCREGGGSRRRRAGLACRGTGRHRRAEQCRRCRKEAHPQRRCCQPVRLRTRIQRPRRCPRDPAGDLCLRALPGRTGFRGSGLAGHDLCRRDLRRREPRRHCGCSSRRTTPEPPLRPG